ncbi:valine tRS [Acrasis kona]|uniref:valine--tRNA ligase n=1 Tax=Acrasis kona TaxID=1008807 RepID=A0AAW2ZGB6_9EUKA
MSKKAVATDKKKKTDIKVEEYINHTPKGQKKDVEKEPIAESYNPMAAEAAWYEWWEECGFFKANNDPKDDRPTFTIMLPPPNVTGSLHLGHALTVSIQDALSRWHRMKGDNVLYLPGVDHAGIATQVVVEKKLASESGQTRHDLGREKFVEKVWEWKEKYGSRIVRQLRRTGASLDWSRECFTMDQKLSEAVVEAFVRLHEKGLIFRANRLVNWDCKLKTAVSNIEVDKREFDVPKKIQVPGHDPKKYYEFGCIWSFDYECEDDPSQRMTIATTRPETMLGDVAVAVNSKDPRWTNFHGKFLRHPFIKDRRMPVIIDDELVSLDVGTGAVKITPAHDPNDFACGKRHNLPQINIFNEDGTINENGGEFAGMMRFDARVEVLKRLTELGYFKEKLPNKMAIGVCSRSGDIIEPYMKPQWYMNCDDVAARAVKASKDKTLRIIPEREESTWYRWLENIQDWCISRQLWWGHRIPAYRVSIFKDVEKTQQVPSEQEEEWIVAKSQEEALQKALSKYHSQLSQIEPDASKHSQYITLQQDEDVLDTWFSSGLFPFSTLGWPEDTSQDLSKFFPNNLLETGSDIIFFWVSRMVMMSLALTDKLPFSQVFLHAMIRDKDGRKMSKSLGNVIDPIDVIEGISLDALHEQLLVGNLGKDEIEKAKKLQKQQFPEGIPQNGTDALRFTLLSLSNKESRDINLDVMKVFYYRTLCNKIWNAVKYASGAIKDFEPISFEEMSRPEIDFTKITFSDKWILSRLENCITLCDEAMSNYEFGQYTLALYQFWLFEFCDVYVEASKPVLYATLEEQPNRRSSQLVLYTCLEQALRLLHPAMPFMTEELWQRLPGRNQHTPKHAESIMINEYPRAQGWRSVEVEQQMELVMKAVKGIRQLKSSYNLTHKHRPNLYVKSSDKQQLDHVMNNTLELITLSQCGSVTVLEDNKDAPTGCAAFIVSDQLVEYLDLTGLIDFAAEHAKQVKNRDQKSKFLSDLVTRMQGASYAKVPEKTRLMDQEKAEKYKGEIAELEKNIADLSKLL